MQMSVRHMHVLVIHYCAMKFLCSSWWLQCSSASSSSLTLLATEDEDGFISALTNCRLRDDIGLRVRVNFIRTRNEVRVSIWQYFSLLKNHSVTVIFNLMWFLINRDYNFFLYRLSRLLWYIFLLFYCFPVENYSNYMLGFGGFQAKW